MTATKVGESFKVVHVGRLELGSSNMVVLMSTEPTITLALERYVDNQIEPPPSPEETAKARLQLAYENKDIDEDTLKMAKTQMSTAAAFLSPAFERMNGPTSSKRVMRASVQVTEDEYEVLGKPAYGDYVRLTVGGVKRE